MNIVKEKNRHRENGGSFLGVFIFLGWMSHILELNSKRQKRRPLRQISARLQAVPCVICLQWFVSKRLFSYPVVELGREVEFAIAEMACVSSNVRRTFHVPSGVRVQRSISGRDVSHPRMVFYFYSQILIGCLGILGLLHRRMVVVSHLFRPQRS